MNTSACAALRLLAHECNMQERPQSIEVAVVNNVYGSIAP